MRSSFRGRVLLSALVVAAILGVAGGIIATTGGESSRADDPSNASLRVGDRPAGRPIPSGFLGLSLEYQTIEAYAGSDPAKLNPVLLALIRNISPAQPPVLRIGGDSADRTWWPVPGMTRPAGVGYALDPQWLNVTGALAQNLNARLILGINLEAKNPALAAAEAQHLTTGLRANRIVALELGNEPELYATFPWYYDHTGRKVYGRASNYNFDEYLQEYSASAAGLHGPLAGPTTGGKLWPYYLEPFLTAEPNTSVVTLHRYPLQRCFTARSSPEYPTLSNLLAPAASTGLADGVAPEVQIAHSHNLPIRIDEMNSVSCGSAAGVSQTFAAGLWAIDALFEMARVGVDGVNIHTFPGAGYELFNFSRSGNRWRATVSPEYYALMMFAQAAPAGSQLLPVTGARPAHLKAWATRTSDGTTRIVLINEDTSAHSIDLNGAGLGGTGTLETLTAPGLGARDGVTLGGRSLGAQTSTGVMPAPAGTALARKAGRYAVSVAPASALLLTFMRNR